MMNTNHVRLVESTDGIRIVGINTDKTRRTANSETRYQVYFALSKAPTAVWRLNFLEEWAGLRPASTSPWPEAVIDGGFLWITCPLSEVDTTYLPALKEAVAAANVSNQHHLQVEARAEERRRQVWVDDRRSVEEMAASLYFG